MSGRLQGKVAVVIGAGSSGPGWGNGKATAMLFAREGAKVFCVDVDEAAAAETVGLIRAQEGTAEAWHADGSDERDVERLVEACLQRLGRIDVLDNNVGVVQAGSVVDVSADDWDRTFATNLKSCYLTMKHVIPVMESQGGGSIINISSISSIRYTGVSYVAYNASKAAMNALTRVTAVEFASKNIRVNAILPGLMKTPMVERSTALLHAYGQGDIDETWRHRAAQCPMGRMGDAWDVAHAAVFLASDEARYITGVELVVDGGITLKYS